MNASVSDAAAGEREDLPEAVAEERGGAPAQGRRLLLFTLGYLPPALLLGLLLAENLAPRLRFEDALIVLRYARNLAAGHGFVFNPGERIFGVTTPLYTLLSAAFVALGGRAAPTLQNLFGIACLLTEAWLVGALVLRRHPWFVAAPAAALTLANFHLSYLVLGMEVHLFAALVLAAFLLYWSEHEVACGVVLGLAFLTRYDAALPALLLVGRRTWERRRIPWRLALPAAALAVPWLLFAAVYFGSLLPQTLAAKRGFVSFAGYLRSTLHSALAMLGGAAGALGLPSGRVAALLLAALAVIGAVRWVRLGPAPALLVATAASHLLVYAAIGADPGFSWHTYLVTPVLWIVLAVGAFAVLRALGELAGGLAGGRLALARGLPAVVLVLALLPLGTRLWRGGAYHYEPDPHTRQMTAIAAWLDARFGEETTLLHPAIGLLGWNTELRLVDLAGLVTPGLYYFDGARSTPLADAVRRYRPDLVLTRAAERDGLKELGYRPIHRFAGADVYFLYGRADSTAPFRTRPPGRAPED